MTETKNRLIKREIVRGKHFVSPKWSCDFIPELLNTQKKSFKHFLERNGTHPCSLEKVFKSAFPIIDGNEKIKIEYLDYELETPQFSPEECKNRGITYASKLILKLRTTVKVHGDSTNVEGLRGFNQHQLDVNIKDKEKNFVEITKEQAYFVGYLPLQTKTCTFIINGNERYVISQLKRCSGPLLCREYLDAEKLNSSFVVKIIPNRGSWIEFYVDSKNIIFVKIDRKKKLPFTTFLMCFPPSTGDINFDTYFSKEKILRSFYLTAKIEYISSGEKLKIPVLPELLTGRLFTGDLLDENNNIVFTANTIIEKKDIIFKSSTKFLYMPMAHICNFISLKDVFNEKTGEIYLESGDNFSNFFIEYLRKEGVDATYEVLCVSDEKEDNFVIQTVRQEKNNSRQEALITWARLMKHSEYAGIAGLNNYFTNSYLSHKLYDMSSIGRRRCIQKFRGGLLSKEEIAEYENSTTTHLMGLDIINMVQNLVAMYKKEIPEDDPDSYINRRIRSVGELLCVQIATGLEKITKKLHSKNIYPDSFLLNGTFFNAKTILYPMHEFLNTSPLSQYAAQENILSSISHACKLSVFGAGGIVGNTTAPSMRDINPSQYGLICPDETPEGPHIGLVTNQAVAAQIDDDGFLMAPFYKVKNGIVSSDIIYLNAFELSKKVMASKSVFELNKNNQLELKDKFLMCKYQNTYKLFTAEEVEVTEISPLQMFSISTAHLPNSQYGDGYRSAMAAAMSRQALVLLHLETPLVGTGMEKHSAMRSGEVVLAKNPGIVRMVDSRIIVVESGNESDVPNIDLYELKKFGRSNQDTSVNQRPVVKMGDIVQKDAILADGYSTYKGELALGRNFLTMYLANKYGFEDAMKLNKDLVDSTKCSSLHVYELEVKAQDTRHGTEEITRDLPDIRGSELRNLDENGIIQVGSKVEPGDYLVGKITPESERKLDPQKKLLQAIFLNKAETYKKTPLVVPASISGIVTKVKIFTKAGIELSGSALVNLQMELDRKKNTFTHSKNIFIDFLREKICHLIKGQKLSNNVGMLKKNTIITEEISKNIFTLSIDSIRILQTTDEKINSKIKILIRNVEEQITKLETQHKQELTELSTEYKFPDDTTLQIVKVYITTVSKTEVGDKFASRYGNKGVISKIENRIDMPYLEDGRIVDMVLNPLGTVARMNLGQLYEMLTNIFSEKMRSCVNKFLNQYLKYKNDATFAQLINALKDAVGGENVGHFFIEEKEDLKIYELTIQETLQLAHKITEGVYSLVPPFETVNLDKIKEMLAKHQLPTDGKVRAFDGKTSEELEGFVLVGMQFLMQLVHRVQNKIHARSVGPYLQHTGQPTNGKQRGGGQKHGEMELWTVGAHGAAFLCQETSIKSDDAKTRKECFIKQCSNNVFSLLTGYIKKEINILNKLDVRNKVSEEEAYVEASFTLVKEELFACGFKMFQRKIMYVNQIIKENEEGEEDPINDFIMSNEEIDIDALEEKNFEEKIKLYNDDTLPQYEKIVSFALVSPEDILHSSHGEVLTTETLNYRTNNPERNGLFCEVIFGPVNNYECACKKYTQKKYYRITCDKCGVTVLHSSARRTRRGHVELVYPMIHPFYLRPTNNKICMLLDISYKDLLFIKSLEKYIITNPGLSQLKYKQIITKEELEKLSTQIFEFGIVIETGAKALRELLSHIDFTKEKETLKEKIEKSNSDFTKKHCRQVLSMVHKLELNKIRPEWMILTRIPVLPANLRQIVEIAPNEFASSDLNALYREVIGRNNRLKNLIELEITETVIDNEIRMLQESINALFGGTVAMKGSSKYKALAEFLQGKTGRFRQNLLGKRVDYSGRSVIVVAPDLRMDECYIPREMLIVLFEPYMYFLLKRYGIVNTWKDSKKILEDRHNHNKIWDLLAEAVKYLPYCLLNRAPSLHRLSMMGFKIKIWDHKAIGLHPLVCSAFNADFDGDQMAVHLPLSVEGQLEAEILMTPTNNILSATNGQLIIGPRQDITIGIYTLTMKNSGKPRREKLLTFFNIYEVQQALLLHKIHAREEIIFVNGHKYYETTVGRVLIWEVMPKHEEITFDIINKPITDKIAHSLLKLVRKHRGDHETVNLAENIKRLGFEYAEKFGISIGLDDFPRVENVANLKTDAHKKQIDYELQYLDGLITSQDKNKKIHQLWTHVIHSIKEELESIMKSNNENPVFLSIKSGARGSILQLMQIIGLKGFVSHVDGSTSGFVIQGNYINGLTPFEAFDAQTAARTVGSNSSLKTAASGYLTRKLVDALHAIVVNMVNCGTQNGITISYTIRNGQIQSTLSEQLLGRVLAEDILNPLTGEVVFKRNHFMLENDLEKINSIGIVKCKIRSPLFCESRNGICVKCYGSDLSTGQLVVLGEAVGIIAAQSIGEPGSQLTLKSKSFGGVAQHDITSTSIIAAFAGVVKYIKIKTININGEETVFSRGGKMAILNSHGNELIEYIVPYGAILLKENSTHVLIGDMIAKWELNQPILCEYEGICRYENILDKITCDVFYDDTLGQFYKIIKGDTNTGNNLTPVLIIFSKTNPLEELVRYVLEEHTTIEVEDGSEVFVGTKLGKIQNHVLEKIDIVGGLPKVSAFLENRQPKIPALLAPFGGYVDIHKDGRGRTKIHIINEKNKNEVVEYIPTSKNHRFVVHHGDYVDQGDELTIGTPLLNDILNIKGIDEFFKYFNGGIKKIYEEQGILIKNIHFEVIAARLLSKAVILDTGDSLEYVVGEITEYNDILDHNQTLVNPIRYKRMFMGLTATALSTPSLLSAMSFQGTTLILADSIVKYQKLVKLGFKEALILGELPCVGTGFIVRKLLNTMLFCMGELNSHQVMKNQEEIVSDGDSLEFYQALVEEAPLNKEL